jgi:hypothetical protein
MERMQWKLVGALSVAAVLLIDFFPHFGPPQFRYAGSDPQAHVWNLGWPVATLIYDQRSGMHAGPFFYVLIPIEVGVVAVASLVFSIRRRANRRGASGVKRVATA